MSQARAARRPVRTLHLKDRSLQRERQTEMLLTGTGMLLTAIVLLISAEPSLPVVFGADLLSAGPPVVIASLGLLLLGLLTSRRWRHVARRVEQQATRALGREQAELAQSHDSIRSQAALLQRTQACLRQREAELLAARQAVARRDHSLRRAQVENRRLRERLETLAAARRADRRDGAVGQQERSAEEDMARADTLTAHGTGPLTANEHAGNDPRTQVWAPGGQAEDGGERTQIFVAPRSRRCG